MSITLSRNFLIVLIALVFVGGAGTAYAGVVLPTITLGGNVDVIGDMEFTSDTTSLTFPSTAGSNQPMIEMFASGTSNADRMVIGHSQGFPNYGLEYRDVGDEFVFKSDSEDVVTIDLDGGMTVNGDCAGCMKFYEKLHPGPVAGLNTLSCDNQDQVISGGGWSPSNTAWIRESYALDVDSWRLSMTMVNGSAVIPGAFKILCADLNPFD